MVTLHEHGSNVTLIEGVVTLAHVVTLCGWGGLFLPTVVALVSPHSQKSCKIF